MKSFGEIIQNQLLFEGFGIMKSSGDQNVKKMLILNPKVGSSCLILVQKQLARLKQGSKASTKIT